MTGEGASAADFRFYCPACGRALTSSNDAVGKRAACPLCKVSITIPPAPAPASPCGDPAGDGDFATIDLAPADEIPLAALAVPNNDPPTGGRSSARIATSSS